MKAVGNNVNNRQFNPNGAKPSIPLDIDEVDSAMERFLRQKYEHRAFEVGSRRPTVKHHTGSTSSDEPPPLPPKPNATRFGFGARSVSSPYLSSSHNRLNQDSPPLSPDSLRYNGRSPSPPKVDKYTRNYAALVGSTGESMESKLASLKDMGFSDAKRNTVVLKGLGGNMEKTVESLIRLGEGTAGQSRSRAPNPPSFDELVTVAEKPKVMAPAPPSNNPFERPPTNAQLPPTPHTTGSQQTFPPPPISTQESRADGGGFSYNPFGNFVNTQPHSAELLSSGVQISQPSLQNAAGGVSLQQQTQPQLGSTFTKTLPAAPQHAYTYPQPQLIQPQSTQQPPGMANGTANPFLHQPPQYQTATNPYVPVQGIHPYLSGQLAQTQPADANASFLYSQQQHMPPFSGQADVPEQPVRADKSSIMALFNYPHLAPAPLPTASPTTLSPTAELPLSNSQTQPPLLVNGPTRSVSTPIGPASGSRNPFLSSNGGATSGSVRIGAMSVGGVGRHVSQESVDIGGLQNGRHSPDAFANLSARFVR